MARLGAGTRKRTDGMLEKRFTVNGRRYSIYARTSKELVQKEQEIRKKIEAGIYTDNRSLTLDKYFEEWLTGKRNGTKGNTLKTYKSYYYKHVSPKIGSRKVQQIERREILALQKEIAEHLSVSTCNTVLKMLKVVLNDAIQDAVISKSPADGIKSLKDTDTKASETYHRALTEQEQKDFMQEMAQDYYYEFVSLLLCTGMRSGEAAALTWDDIDYKQNVIHVVKTATFNEDGTATIGSPKSEAGKRDIPLNDTIKDILLRQRKKQGSIIQIENRVFTTVYGGMVHNHAVNRAISDTLARLKERGKPIEHFTAHALRDTFATRYIEQGGSPQTLKTILGHNSLAMTMDLYSHVLPNTKQKEMDNLKIVL
ncbi:MAG: site-specific integrase [Lachnospiraceae bacterium]|nr:site-specific integrase [Lachnospiraceae bacterium]